jgi:geranylgeranyl pyrophosphate synthase
MPNFSDLLQPSLAMAISKRLKLTAVCMQSVLINQHFPPKMLAYIQALMRQPGKLLGSPTAIGEPLSDSDQNLWPLHAILAHAAASETANASATEQSWKQIGPIAAMAEFVGLALDIIDDIQDGDAHFPEDLPTAQALTLAITLLAAAVQVIADDAIPQTVRAAINERIAIGLIHSTSGQFLDIAYEHAQNITAEMSLEMTSRKSGSLIGLIFETSALVGASQKRSWREAVAISELFRQLGEQIGLRHQLQNDLHDAAEDSPKSDRARGKRTLPLVLVYELEINSATPSHHIETATVLTNMAITKANREAEAILNKLATQHGVPIEWLTWLAT